MVGVHRLSGRACWDDVVGPVPDDDAALQPFDCPRCGTRVSERLWGPCSSCREDLRAMGGPGREVAAPAYVPKVNVTPNAVALRDD